MLVVHGCLRLPTLFHPLFFLSGWRFGYDDYNDNCYYYCCRYFFYCYYFYDCRSCYHCY